MQIGPLLKKLKGLSSSIFLRKSKESIKWFRDKLKSMVGNTKKAGITELPQSKRPPIGSLCQFYYDPKWKDVLPFWDKFPLALVIGWYDDGFLALNIHYLPMGERAAILDVLMDIKKKSRNDKQYAEISYKFMIQAAGNSIVSHTIKRYLSNHVRSSILLIDQEEWENVIFLPTHQFQKASAAEVWGTYRK